MANSARKTILVPWDFTEQSEIALQHAHQLAQVVGDNIMLVHFVKRSRFAFGKASKQRLEKKVEEIRNRLEDEALRLSQKYDAQRTALSADIAKSGTTSRQLHRVSIITHALEYKILRKALRELFISMDINLAVARHFYQEQGSKRINLVKVLRRVKSGRVDTMPFIVVDKAPVHQYYTELVVPMDYENSYKETLRWVAYLSNYYHCNVNLIKPQLRDDRKKRGMANNLYFTKKILESKNVVYGVKTARRATDFRQEVFTFSKTIDSDMLILMTDKMKVYFPNGNVKSDVPVMFINPLSKRYQSFY